FRMRKQFIVQPVQILAQQIHHDRILIEMHFRHRVIQYRKDMRIELADIACLDRIVPGIVGARCNLIYIECAVPVDEELEDRKSTRLNSSHVSISYAVFCLKKKK